MNQAAANAFVQTLQSQRNTALDTIAQMAGEIADLNERLQQSESEKEALQKNPPPQE